MAESYKQEITRKEDKNEKEKIFAVIFCMVITVALFAGVGMPAFAADFYKTVDNIEYELVGRGAEQEYYVKSGRTASGDVVIPAEIDGIPVTEILASAFENNNQITSVAMSDNIIRVHGAAFSRCHSLSSVTLGANVWFLGWGTFDSCFQLRSITINDKLAGIQKQAFRNCLCLQSITMGIGLETIEENAFEGCNALQTVTLPDSVSLEGTGVGEEVRVSLNEKLKAELPEMMAQRDEMQAELDAFSSRVEAVREFLGETSTNAGSAFGSGNIMIISACVAVIAAMIIGGIVIVRKKSAKKKEEEA